MSYFSNNKLYSYYEVDKSVVGSQQFTEDVIEIINNESVLFDLTKMNVWTSSTDVLNSFDVDTIKFYIDWGDGKTERLSKPLISNKSTIGVHKPNEWKIVEHVFVVDKKSQNGNVITISAFNSFDEKLTIKIPYNVIYKTIYDLGSEFSLFSANTTNTNKVSYTLKQNNTDSLMVISSVDEKEKLFGKENELEIDNFVNETYSDEFVDQDFMVWDWNTLPTIIFNDVVQSENGFLCSFRNEGIEVESWYPQVKLIDDKGEEKNITITKTENDFEFFVKCEDYGVYEVFLSPLSGMNGTKGKSDKSYIKNSLLVDNPKHLRQYKDEDGKSVIPVIIGNRGVDFGTDKVTENQNELVFTFTLADDYQLKSLTKLDLILQAVSVNNTSYDFINDITFKYDVLSSLIDENGTPKYINEQDGDMKLQYIIRMKDIPDKINYNGHDYEIAYEAWFETNDVLGGKDNNQFTLYNEETGLHEGKIKNLTGEGVVQDEYDKNNTTIVFDYKIGKFNGSLTTSDKDETQVDKTFDLSWSFTPYDYWENFIVNSYTVKEVSILDENGEEQKVKVKDTLLSNDYHTYQGDNNKHVFSGLSFNENNFTKVIDGNKIPNGYIWFDVTYRSEMNDYYDVRESNTSSIIYYEYPRPILSIDDINPYVTITYDKNRNTQDLKLNLKISGSSNEKLRDIQISKKDIDKDTLVSNRIVKLEYNDLNIPFQKSNFDYTFSAYNINDRHNRIGNSDTKPFVMADGISKLKTLPSDGKDYLSGDVSRQYLLLDEENSEGENPIVDWLWVKQNTLHDIDKYYKFEKKDENGNVEFRYFGHQYCGDLSFDDKTRWLLYDIVSLKDGENVIRRFKPIIADTELDMGQYKEELGTIDQQLNGTHNPVVTYNKNEDDFNLLLKWDNQHWEYVKNMFLNLYKVEKEDGSEEVQNEFLEQKRLDVEKLTEFLFKKLGFGQYTYEIILNSEEVKTSENTKKFTNVIDLVVPFDECAKVYQPVIIRENLDGSKIIEFKWDLYHKSCDSAYFFYGTYKAENDQVEDGGSTQEPVEGEPNEDEGEYDIILPDTTPDSTPVRMQIKTYDANYKNGEQGKLKISVKKGENVFYGLKMKSSYLEAKDSQDYDFLDDGEKLIFEDIIYTKDV